MARVDDHSNVRLMSSRSLSQGLASAIVFAVFASVNVVQAQTLSTPNTVEVTVASPVPTNETTALPAGVAPSNAARVEPVVEATAVPNTDPVSVASPVTNPVNGQALSETKPVPKAQEPTGDWSLGAGGGWAAYSTGLVSSSADSMALGSMPLGSMGSSGTAIAFLERRLTKTIYAFVQPTFSYTLGKGPSEEHTSYSRSFALGAGARWVLNPDALVEVGMSHALQINSSGFGDEYDGTWSTWKSSGLGFNTALVVERKLLAQLWLRVAANLLSASWAKTTQHMEIIDGSGSGDGVMRSLSVRLAINPSLALRLEF